MVLNKWAKRLRCLIGLLFTFYLVLYTSTFTIAFTLWKFCIPSFSISYAFHKISFFNSFKKHRCLVSQLLNQASYIRAHCFQNVNNSVKSIQGMITWCFISVGLESTDNGNLQVKIFELSSHNQRCNSVLPTQHLPFFMKAHHSSIVSFGHSQSVYCSLSDT